MTNADILQAMIDGTMKEHPSILLPPPIRNLIGFRFTALDTVELDADPSVHANPMGTVHGGVLCTIADAAIGSMHWASLSEGETFTSIDFRINFFRPVWKDRIVAKAQLINGGKSVSYYGCDITRGDGKLVAQATSTVMTLRGDAASGR